MYIFYVLDCLLSVQIKQIQIANFSVFFEIRIAPRRMVNIVFLTPHNAKARAKDWVNQH
jgi:hypothetical protein